MSTKTTKYVNIDDSVAEVLYTEAGGLWVAQLSEEVLEGLLHGLGYRKIGNDD